MLGRDKKSKTRENYSDHTLVAPSATISGNIEFSGGLHVLGNVEGSITVKDGSSGRLVVGESGVVKGEIRVSRVVINGHVEGDVHASEHLELAEKATVEGNVYYKLIEMVMGAQVNGKLVRTEQKQLPHLEEGSSD